jgi:hypothetical protein
MSLNETNKKNLEDKDFDKLFNNKKQNRKWNQLANNAYQYAKVNLTHGKEPRLDDVAGALYGIIAADDDFRSHQDENNARGKRWIQWFTQYVVDKVFGEGRANT